MDPFWLQVCLCPLATATVSSGRQEWASSPWSPLGGCPLGRLFCILTPLRQLFGSFLHPGSINFQFLPPAEDPHVLRKSSTFIRQIETRDTEASLSAQDMQWEWTRARNEFYSRQPYSVKQRFQPSSAIKGLFVWRGFQLQFSTKEMEAWIRKCKWIWIT